MKKFYLPVLSILTIPLAFLGGILLACARNRERASRFYDAAGHPRDDGTRLVLPLKVGERLSIEEKRYAHQTN